jgi:hypothetical protein
MLAAANLAPKIQKRKMPIEDGILERHAVSKKGWAGLNTPELVAEAAPILEECGLLRPQSRNPRPSRRPRMVKIFKCVERSRSSIMDVEDEHNHMRAAFGLRYRIGQPATPAAE